ncbi:MAG: hypothetical protein R3D60_14890 [Paracoccaceae bacterium]
MIPISIPDTPGRRATASLTLVAQDPQSMPETVQSQAVVVEGAACAIAVLPPERAVAFIESGN